MNIYIIMALGEIFGIALHTSFKMIKIKRKMKLKGVKMSWKQVMTDYFDDEGDTWILALCFSGALLFVASEFFDLKHLDQIDYSIPLKERLLHYKITQWIKLSSIIAGFVSSSSSFLIIGTADDKIRDKVEAITKQNSETDISQNKN